MKLIDYLENPVNQQIFLTDELKNFEENAYLCEVHQTDLFIVNGYTTINVDIQVYPDWEFENQNPHNLFNLTAIDSFEKPVHFQSEEKKIIYCQTCLENTEKHHLSEHTEKRKKIKGRKSKKYKNEKK